MGADLWIPGAVAKRQRGVVTLSKEEMGVMAAFADVATKYGFAVVCPKCDETLHGQNDGTREVFSVACGCREYRAFIPAWMR